jgi:uncharacterized protein Usg
MKKPTIIQPEAQDMARDFLRNWQDKPLIFTFLKYRLVTVDILFHLPDYPSVLQNYMYQTLDSAPHFPEVRKFVEFWQTNLDGKIHSVRLSAAELIKSTDFSHGSYIN